MGVCTKEHKRTGVAAEVLMATPCTNSLGGESRGHKHEGCGGRSACWKCAAVSWVGSGRPSMLMLVRSAAALATMRPVLLLRVLKKAARR